MCNRCTLIDPGSVFTEIARILGIRLDKPKWVNARYNIDLMRVSLVPVARRSEKAELGPSGRPVFWKGYSGRLEAVLFARI